MNRYLDDRIDHSGSVDSVDKHDISMCACRCVSVCVCVYQDLRWGNIFLRVVGQADLHVWSMTGISPFLQRTLGGDVVWEDLETCCGGTHFIVWYCFRCVEVTDKRQAPITSMSEGEPAWIFFVFLISKWSISVLNLCHHTGLIQSFILASLLDFLSGYRPQVLCGDLMCVCVCVFQLGRKQLCSVPPRCGPSWRETAAGCRIRVAPRLKPVMGKSGPSWRETAAGCSSAMTLRPPPRRRSHGKGQTWQFGSPNTHLGRQRQSCFACVQDGRIKKLPAEWRRRTDQSGLTTNQIHPAAHTVWGWKVNVTH